MDKTNSQKICFVICPIGEPDSDVRRASDEVTAHIIVPALRDFHIVRAHEISDPGIITMQVIEKLVKADLVVADLTDHNPNVFYELAVRHVVKKPIIQIIKNGQKIPFDVGFARTFPYDLNNVVLTDECRKQMKEAASKNDESSPFDNFLSFTFELMSSKNSTSGNGQLYSQILEGFARVEKQLMRLDDRIKSSPEPESILQQTGELGELKTFSNIIEQLGKLDLMEANETLTRNQAAELRNNLFGALRNYSRKWSLMMPI